jgi:transcriptional regulator with XRE-family HTH domain
LPPPELQGLGSRLRKKRLARGLTRKALGDLLGVTSRSICGWEQGEVTPHPTSISKILDFLNYEPEPGSLSLGERLRTARRRAGLRQNDLSTLLGISLRTITKVETGRLIGQRTLAVIERYLGGKG